MSALKIQIGIIGDFDAKRPSHLATNNALIHAAELTSGDFEICWLPTRKLETDESCTALQSYSGLWGAPGDHDSSLGMINAIRAAREQNIPYLGT